MDGSYAGQPKADNAGVSMNVKVQVFLWFENFQTNLCFAAFHLRLWQ